MIANTAFLAALTVFLLAAWLAGELTFLAPYKATLFREFTVPLPGCPPSPGCPAGARRTWR